MRRIELSMKVFSWQVQYLVMLESDSARRIVRDVSCATATKH